MTATYTPQRGSIPARVVAFFQANPEELLGIDEIVEKFDASRCNVHTILRLATEAGLLVRDRDADDDYVYRPGPLIGASASSGIDIDAAHRHSQPPFPATTERLQGRAARVVVDMAAVQISDSVPIPTGTGRQGPRQYNELLDRMTPGDSAGLPGQYFSTLAKHLTLIHKAELRRFITSRDRTADTLRVWRTA